MGVSTALTWHDGAVGARWRSADTGTRCRGALATISIDEGSFFPWLSWWNGWSRLESLHSFPGSQCTHGDPRVARTRGITRHVITAEPTSPSGREEQIVEPERVVHPRDRHPSPAEQATIERWKDDARNAQTGSHGNPGYGDEPRKHAAFTGDRPQSDRSTTGRYLQRLIAISLTPTVFRQERLVPALDSLKRLDPARLAYVYLLLIFVAESITNLVSPVWGTVLHVLVFGSLLVHSAVDPRTHARGLLLTLALVPLIRILSLGLPLEAFNIEWWYVVTGVPLFAASISAARSLELSRHQIGLCLPGLRGWLLTAVAAMSGLLIGVVEYGILAPTEVTADPSLSRSIFFAASLLFGTGITEELVFRGILQVTASAVLGTVQGIVYSSVLFAVMHMGHDSAVYTLFILAVGAYFGFVRHRTGSLLGVIVAHTLANVVLYIVLAP